MERSGKDGLLFRWHWHNERIWNKKPNLRHYRHLSLQSDIRTGIYLFSDCTRCEYRIDATNGQNWIRAKFPFHPDAFIKISQSRFEISQKSVNWQSIRRQSHNTRRIRVSALSRPCFWQVRVPILFTGNKRSLTFRLTFYRKTQCHLRLRLNATTKHRPLFELSEKNPLGPNVERWMQMQRITLL